MNKFKRPQPQGHNSAPQPKRAGNPRQPTPAVAQPKSAPAAATVRQPLPTAGRPAAPSVYRPQPTPKVLQRKAAGPTAPPPTDRPKGPPKAPPAQRPGAQNIARPKAAALAQTTAAAQTPLAQGQHAARPRPAALPTSPQRQRAAGQILQAKPKQGPAHGQFGKDSTGAALHPARVVQRTASRVGPHAPHPASKGVIQCGRITAFDSCTAAKCTNVKLDENERAAAILLAKDIEGILEQAQSNVDEGYSTTNSALALARDTGSRARGAKRGTAIHSETYQIIGDQMKGYGSIEKVTTGGRVDIVLDLFGSGKKVIYDLTSYAQGTKTHTSSRGYEQDKTVAMIIEITYDDY